MKFYLPFASVRYIEISSTDAGEIFQHNAGCAGAAVSGVIGNGYPPATNHITQSVEELVV